MGLTPVVLPLFAARPVPWTAPDPRRHDVLILTSANAVRHAGQGLPQLTALPVWCVGEATARAARDAGLHVVKVGTGNLRDLVGSSTCNQPIWIAGAAHQMWPTAAPVTIVPVYAMEPTQVASADLPSAGVVLLHSARAAERWASLIPAPQRRTFRIIAISAAVAEAAGAGWGRTVVAAHPTDRDMLEQAARMCQNGPHA